MPYRITMLPTEESESDLTSLKSVLNDYSSYSTVPAALMSDYYSQGTELHLLRTLFANRATRPDVIEVDNIWPGTLADDLVDLRAYPELANDRAGIDKSLLEPFIVKGRLVALPLFITTSVLYYRTDLLLKNGFTHPPATWEELAKMAAVIQAGERKGGHPDFWGFVWQGASGEGLTCTALEWQRSEGAGLFNQNGVVNTTGSGAEMALRRARSWVGTISPPGVVEYDEYDSDNAWLEGLSGFTRGWLYLYDASKKSANVRGRFAVAPMPLGSQGRAWTFGGMGIAISKYSLHPHEAANFIHYLLSPHTQKQRLLISSVIPVKTSLLKDSALLKDTALGGWMGQHWQEGMFSRPAALTGNRYEAVSSAYSQSVHNVIAGKQDAHEAMLALQQQLTAIMR